MFATLGDGLRTAWRWVAFFLEQCWSSVIFVFDPAAEGEQDKENEKEADEDKCEKEKEKEKEEEGEGEQHKAEQDKEELEPGLETLAQRAHLDGVHPNRRVHLFQGMTFIQDVNQMNQDQEEGETTVAEAAPLIRARTAEVSKTQASVRPLLSRRVRESKLRLSLVSFQDSFRNWVALRGQKRPSQDPVRFLMGH